MKYHQNAKNPNKIFTFFFQEKLEIFSRLRAIKFFFFIFFFEMICAPHFYNIFATNFKRQVVIVGLKK